MIAITKTKIMCCVFILSLYAVAEEKNDLKAFIKCPRGVSCNEDIESYRKFVKKYPKSEFADDAYLEIAELQTRDGRRDDARHTLKEVKEKYPDAHKRRYVYTCFSSEICYKEWGKFINKYPVFTKDYADYKLAKLDYEDGEYEKAQDALKSLIDRTITSKEKQCTTNPLTWSSLNIRTAAMDLYIKASERKGDEIKMKICKLKKRKMSRK